jgi:hypothetical protein
MRIQTTREPLAECSDTFRGDSKSQPIRGCYPSKKATRVLYIRFYFSRGHPQSQRHRNRQRGRQNALPLAVNLTPPGSGVTPGKDNSVIDFSYFFVQELTNPRKCGTTPNPTTTSRCSGRRVAPACCRGNEKSYRKGDGDSILALSLAGGIASCRSKRRYRWPGD